MESEKRCLEKLQNKTTTPTLTRVLPMQSRSAHCAPVLATFGPHMSTPSPTTGVPSVALAGVAAAGATKPFSWPGTNAGVMGLSVAVEDADGEPRDE